MPLSDSVYMFRGDLPRLPTTISLPALSSPSLPILPTISEAYDLEMPRASPIPSWVISKGASSPESMLYSLYL